MHPSVKVHLRAALAGLLLCAATVWAKGTPGIKNTIHNLSTTVPYAYYASDQQEPKALSLYGVGPSIKSLWSK